MSDSQIITLLHEGHIIEHHSYYFDEYDGDSWYELDGEDIEGELLIELHRLIDASIVRDVHEPDGLSHVSRVELVEA